MLSLCDVFNDIITFVANMDKTLKVCIVALISMLLLLLLGSMVKTICKSDSKFKFKFLPFLIFVILASLLIFISIYTF